MKQSKVTFLGQEKLILSHNKTNYGTIRVTFWDRRSWILSHNKKNYGTK
jgi:hypothetical protein